MDDIEDVEEYEYVDPESFRTVLAITGKYRGHRLYVRMTVSCGEVDRNPRLKDYAKRALRDELEFQADKLRPVLVERTVEDDFADFLRARDVRQREYEEMSAEERRAAPRLAAIRRRQRERRREQRRDTNWRREGF